MMYLSFLFVYTLIPYQFSKCYFYQFLMLRKEYFATIFGSIKLFDILINIIMFMPVGFLITSLLKSRLFNSKKTIIITTITGFILSATIEFSQLFLPRTTSVIDLLTNTIGTSLGASLVYSINSYNPENFSYKIFEFIKRHFLPLFLGYTLFATVVFLLPPLLNNFNNWNNNYLFQVGNEATMDRPWNGTIYKLSIFNRLLKQKEIETYYTEGLSQKTGAENSAKPLLEYMFENLPVQNSGSIKEQLFLFPQTDSNIKKLPKQNGVFISGNSILQSQIPAARLVEKLKSTDQLSIAVWIKPQNLKMMGPARIVSLSADPGNRNFTLGQTQDRINFRVRTPLTGNNGSKVSLTSSSILNSRIPQLIVVTFFRGETKLFCNGKLNSNSTHDVSFFLPPLIGLTKETYKISCFCFTLLFPLGILIWDFSSFNFWKRLLLVFCIFIPSLFSSVFNLLFYQHSVDILLIMLSVAISALVIICGLLCHLLYIFLTRFYFP
jgi:glycopeptide antibiotics resistance protein